MPAEILPRLSRQMLQKVMGPTLEKYKKIHTLPKKMTTSVFLKKPTYIVLQNTPPAAQKRLQLLP